MGGAKEVAETFGKLGEARKKSGAVNVMANMLRMAGRYSDAHQAADAALALCRETGDKSGQAAALCMKATIYDTQHDYVKASFKLERAAKLYKQVKNSKEEAKTLEAVASTQMKVMHMIDDVAEPEKLCRKALAIYKDNDMELSAEAAQCQQTLAFALLLQGNSDGAMREAEASANAFREMGNSGGEAAAYSKIAQIHWNNKEKDEAAKSAGKALKLATDGGNKDEANWANELVKKYGGGDDPSANAAQTRAFTDASGAVLKTMEISMYKYGQDYCLFMGATWRGAGEREQAVARRQQSSSQGVEIDIGEDSGDGIGIDWQGLSSM